MGWVGPEWAPHVGTAILSACGLSWLMYAPVGWYQQSSNCALLYRMVIRLTLAFYVLWKLNFHSYVTPFAIRIICCILAFWALSVTTGLCSYRTIYEQMYIVCLTYAYKMAAAHEHVEYLLQKASSDSLVHWSSRNVLLLKLNGWTSVCCEPRRTDHLGLQACSNNCAQQHQWYLLPYLNDH